MSEPEVKGECEWFRRKAGEALTQELRKPHTPVLVLIRANLHTAARRGSSPPPRPWQGAGGLEGALWRKQGARGLGSRAAVVPGLTACRGEAVLGMNRRLLEDKLQARPGDEWLARSKAREQGPRAAQGLCTARAWTWRGSGWLGESMSHHCAQARCPARATATHNPHAGCGRSQPGHSWGHWRRLGGAHGSPSPSAESRPLAVGELPPAPTLACYAARSKQCVVTPGRARARR